MESITSRRNPLVARFRRAAGRRARDDEVILLDGAHLVEEALGAGVAIEIAAFARTDLDASAGARELAARIRSAGGRVLAVPDDVLGAISPAASASGVTALAARPRRAVDDLLDATPALVLMTVDVQDPGNVGGIIRTAHAAGASGVVASGTSADPYSWKALRGSMGGALHLPVITGLTAPHMLEWAHRHGLARCALAASGGTPLYELDLRRPLLLMVGSEGAGLPEVLRRTSDESISIPMQAPANSLNAAAAAAVVLYEAWRQRHVEGSAA